MIQKTIIANYGDWDMGKTESIYLAYIKLQKMATHHEILHTDKDDVCALLEINDVKVGICSQGDPRSCQKGWMETLVSKDCSIILAACRHYGATVDVIESYKPTYRILWAENARIYQEKDQVHVAPKSIRDRFNEQLPRQLIVPLRLRTVGRGDSQYDR